MTGGREQRGGKRVNGLIGGLEIHGGATKKAFDYPTPIYPVDDISDVPRHNEKKRVNGGSHVKKR